MGQKGIHDAPSFSPYQSGLFHAPDDSITPLPYRLFAKRHLLFAKRALESVF